MDTMGETAVPHWPDRLGDLLPEHIRARDAESGAVLRALLEVFGEQVELIRDDIERLYENWFIETARPWAVPYLGDLVGYRMLEGYEEALSARGEGAARLAARLAPRRDVAATVANRRRKGTLPLLEELAAGVADWPARAVEFHRLLARSAPVRLFGSDEAAARTRARRLSGLGYADLRDGAALDLAGTPFDPLGRGAESARVGTAPGRRQGRYRPPGIGLFVWRLRAYPITHAPAYCIDRGRNLYTFSILGNDAPLFTRPVAEPSAHHLAEAENVPDRISRRALEDRLSDFYGPDKSFTIWRDGRDEPIPPSDVVVADLSGWTYRARRGQVLVDPELGRIAFGPRGAPRRGVWVSYHYGFGADLGGGEYVRGVTTSPTAAVYRVGPGEPYERINDAYEDWQRDNADGGRPEAVIELTHSGAHQEQLEFVLGPGDRLELRAAEATRPVLRLLDWYSNRPDSLQIRGVPCEEGDDRPPPRFTISGLLVTGRGVSVTGQVGAVVIRDSTLVPGWSLEAHCAPAHPEEPSLVLENTTACVQLERAILGTILVVNDEVRSDPIPIHLIDSVLDATGPEREALSAPECRHAHAILHAYRSTVIGEVHVHAVAMGENTIFVGRVHVARRGIGCLRFSYVAPERAHAGGGRPGAGSERASSRTPRRYHCEPDQVWSVLQESAERGDLDPADLPRLRELEAARVRPRFTSTAYGTPAYLQLDRSCAPEITRGAEDGSEMGVFHDLFQPQRADNLRARLDEFTPAGGDAGVIHVT